MDMSSFHPTFSAFILSYIHPVLTLFFQAYFPYIKTRYWNTVRRIYKDLRVKFYFLENPMLLKNIHHAETFPASYLDNKDFLHH